MASTIEELSELPPNAYRASPATIKAIATSRLAQDRKTCKLLHLPGMLTASPHRGHRYLPAPTAVVGIFADRPHQRRALTWAHPLKIGARVWLKRGGVLRSGHGDALLQISSPRRPQGVNLGEVIGNLLCYLIDEPSPRCCRKGEV